MRKMLKAQLLGEDDRWWLHDYSVQMSLISDAKPD